MVLESIAGLLENSAWELGTGAAATWQVWPPTMPPGAATGGPGPTVALLAELALQIALAQLIREGMVSGVDSRVDFLVDISETWHPLLGDPGDGTRPAHRRGWESC